MNRKEEAQFLLPPHTHTYLRRRKTQRIGIWKNASYQYDLFVWFDSLRPLNNLSVMRDGSSWVELVLS